jgi:hypothetical protein
MVAFKTLMVCGNFLMHIRIELDGRSVKTKIVAIGTTTNYKK